MGDRAPQLSTGGAELTGKGPLLKSVRSKALANKDGMYIAAMHTGMYWRGTRQLVEIMLPQQRP